MKKLLTKLFGRAEKTPMPPQGNGLLQQYDEEYIRYCIEQEQVVAALEAHLHISDDPKEIAIQTLKTACSFYGGDWAGVFEVDLDLSVWTPVWWYKAGIKDHTMQLVQECETLNTMPTWIKAMEENRCIIIPDTAATKETQPVEFSVYQRLRTRSVIAAPFAPNPTGYFVIRNPSRHIQQSSMMNILAYVLHRAMAQQKTMDSAKLTPTPDSIQSDKDIVIKFFGDMEITTSRGVLKERDFNSPKSSRVVTYLMLNPKTAHPPMEIYSALWPDDCTPPETASRNIREHIYHFRRAFDLICDYPLIMSTPNGYRLNPNLNIITDVQQFERLCEAAKQAASPAQKMIFTKNAFDLYRGPLFQSAQDEHWLLSQVNHYRLCYVALVNELLGALAAAKDYVCVQHYAAEALRVMPGNLKAHFWLIDAMQHLGTVELAKRELAKAKDTLTEEEYEVLTSYFKEDADISVEELFAPIQRPK